ncbi:hypothetical protein GM658_20755 [Pseudoduganella eburnea]|uniref:Uncharacterized protein n=1 Tax=Massilia eburnea TaxID=1776165 RepID=A0A6L6QLL8_9BURK|nr:hypothetical protein [Massilia eburnea]MTW13040.1 hypothetical protein [Massilia eburnea]
MAWYRPEHPAQLFGQLLVKHKLVTEEQLRSAIEHQRQTGQRLGEIFAEWNLVTQQHVQDILRKQRRVRMAAALLGAIFAPLEAYAAETLAAAPAAITAPAAVLPREGSMAPLAEGELDAVSAQGLDEDLVHQVRERLKQNGVEVNGDLAKLVNPVLGVLDADVSMHNVVYAANRATSTVNPDGSLSLNLPTTIGEINFNNIRVHGAGPGGPSFGSISMRGIDLSGTVISLALKK